MAQADTALEVRDWLEGRFDRLLERRTLVLFTAGTVRVMESRYSEQLKIVLIFACPRPNPGDRWLHALNRAEVRLFVSDEKIGRLDVQGNGVPYPCETVDRSVVWWGSRLSFEIRATEMRSERIIREIYGWPHREGRIREVRELSVLLPGCRESITVRNFNSVF